MRKMDPTTPRTRTSSCCTNYHLQFSDRYQERGFNLIKGGSRRCVFMALIFSFLVDKDTVYVVYTWEVKLGKNLKTQSNACSCS
ncbi:hypothetical protein PIB30_020089 [Stylosanthes scabra]|uniref:Uncharacterized protein n=1 Tax=Stylosanthes scabra TaxID=79078 RepID=A0ABU6V7H4_9FABA|nr:hypothetical protein [Stylosanthes scabra]